MGVAQQQRTRMANLLIEYVTENPGTSVPEICETVDISKSRAHYLLAEHCERWATQAGTKCRYVWTAKGAKSPISGAKISKSTAKPHVNKRPQGRRTGKPNLGPSERYKNRWWWGVETAPLNGASDE